MTREEAIYRLKNMAWLYGSTEREQNIEAVDMAIEALKELQIREQYNQNYETDDWVKFGVTNKNKEKVILYDAFGELEYYPMVRCKDCRHANECHKSVQYTRNEPRTVTIGYSPIEWCSHGERREP